MLTLKVINNINPNILFTGNEPAVLISNKTLAPNEWTDVHIARVGPVVSLKIDMSQSYEAKLASAKVTLNFKKICNTSMNLRRNT